MHLDSQQEYYQHPIQFIVDYLGLVQVFKLTLKS